jgi:putative Mg2+ transporter-C (MgtC) family protein
VPDTFDLAVRLAIAGIAGLVIGFERESRNHVAGVRTHSLVAVGAALFAIAGAYGFGDVPHGPNIDPARVAAQVASGIGFIGAGAIIKHGASVRGITTAATLWAAAALGVAAAAGLGWIVLITTVIVLLALRASGYIVSLIERMYPGAGTLEVVYERGHATLGPLIRLIEGERGSIEGIDLRDDSEDVSEPGLRTVRVPIRLGSEGDVQRLLETLRARPEVVTTEFHAQLPRFFTHRRAKPYE